MGARGWTGSTLAGLVLLAACSANVSTTGTVAVADLPSGSAGSASWTPWPQALHDGRRSASTDAKGPTTGRVRWKRTLEGNVTPGPVVGKDGTIYAASNAGVLHALDPSDGSDRWTFDGGGSYGIDLSTSPAVLPDGTILWPGPQRTLSALDASGTLLWSEEFAGMVSSPATLDGRRVYVADSTGAVTALDVTGAQRGRVWTSEEGQGSYGAPALGADGMVYQTTGDSVVALHDDGASVTRRWSKNLGEGLVEVSAAVAPDGTVVVGTNGTHEFGLRPDGTVAWTFDRDSQSYSSPGVTDTGLAVFGDHQGDLNVVDATNGELRGRFTGTPTPRRSRSIGVWTSPAVDRDHRVYFGTRQGHIYGYAPDGTRLFDVDTGETIDSYPALTGDGALVVGATDGTLYAIADR